MKKIVSILSLLALSLTLLVGCGQKPEAAVEAVDVSIVALKGPTAMGLTKFMSDVDGNVAFQHNYNFSIVGSVDEVTPSVIQGTVDIAAVPANLASVLFNKTQENVKVLAINTLGVLYIVENGESIQNVSDLVGKTIYASGKGATPEYSLNYILTSNGINPETDVTIEWKSEHTECLAELTTKENAIALLPQPFVTSAQNKLDTLRIALDLTAEWDTLQANEETPSALITGVIIANADFVENHPEAVEEFLSNYEASVTFINNDIEAGAQLIGSYEIVDSAIALKALPYCNITFLRGEELKTKLSGYLSVLFEQNPASVGGALPTNDFYY